MEEGTGMEVTAALPHRYPFLMVDRVLALEPGCWAAAVKNVTSDDPFLDQTGRWPSVLLVEAMAQAAGMASAAAGHAATAGVLAAVNRFRCGRAVVAGDRLLVVTRITRRFGSLVQARAVVRAGNARCGAAELVLRVGMPERRGE